MRRVVFIIELLMKLLMLEMIIKVVEETLILTWIMSKGWCSGRSDNYCACYK